MKLKIAKAVALVLAMVCIFCFPVPTSATAQGTDGTELEVIQPQNLEIMSLALISGMFYTTRKDSIGLFLPKAFYGEHYKKHPFYLYLNPDNVAVSMYLPPCMLITSKHDNLRNYTYDLAASIRNNRAPCILRDYGRDPNLTHAFSVFDPELPESWKVIEDIASFFTDYE